MHIHSGMLALLDEESSDCTKISGKYIRLAIYNTHIGIYQLWFNLIMVNKSTIYLVICACEKCNNLEIRYDHIL